MSVYIDPLFDCPTSKQWRWSQASHMIASTIEELHEFAAKIGLRHEWFQDKPGFPHYDLTPSRRLKAVKLGAIELTARKLCTCAKQLRRNKEVTANGS